MSRQIVFDARWIGPHGIGRFATEVRRRLPDPVVDMTGGHPVSPFGLLASEALPHLKSKRESASTYFSPGYTPCLTWRGEHAFTVHDLIHLDVEGEGSRVKQIYYDAVVRRALRRKSGLVFTVSEFSQRRIAQWAGVAPERIVVVGNGVDDTFSPHGPGMSRARPFVLHVGNTKPHKNLERLVHAVAQVPDIDLVCSSAPNEALMRVADSLGIGDRLHFCSGIPEADLPAWYRGARAVVIPSLYEGFGLPALEGMASGTPVVASATTALAEVVQDAGVAVDPTDVASIRDGIASAISDDTLRAKLKQSGPARAADFGWDRVAHRITTALAGGAQ